MDTNQSGKQVSEEKKKKSKAAQDDDEFVEKTPKKKKKATKGKKRGKTSSDSDPSFKPPAKKGRTTRNSNKDANPIPPSPAFNTEQQYALVPATPFAVDTLDAEFAGVVMDAIMVPPTPMPPPPTPLPTPQGGEDPADDELMAPTSQTTLTTTTTTMTNQAPLSSSQGTIGGQNPNTSLASTSGNTQIPPRFNGATQVQAFPILAAPTLPVTNAPPAQRQHPSFLLKPRYPKPAIVASKVTQAPPPTLISSQTTFPKIPVRLIPVPAQTTRAPSPILVPPQTIEAKRTPPQQHPGDQELITQQPLRLTAAQLLAPSHSPFPTQPSVTQNTNRPTEEWWADPEVIHQLGIRSKQGDASAKASLNVIHSELVKHLKGTSEDNLNDLIRLVEGALGHCSIPPQEVYPTSLKINVLTTEAKEGSTQARAELIDCDRRLTNHWVAFCGTSAWNAVNELKKLSRSALASIPKSLPVAPVPPVDPVTTTTTTAMTTTTPVVAPPPAQPLVIQNTNGPIEDFLTPDDIAMMNTQPSPMAPVPSGSQVTTTTTTAVTTTTTTTTTTPVQASTSQIVVTPSFDEVKMLASLARRGDMAARTKVLELVRNSQYEVYLNPQRIGFWNWKDVQTLVSTEPLYCLYATSYTESLSKAPKLFDELKAKATPDNLWAVVGLARVYYWKKQYSEALSLLKSVAGHGDTEIDRFLGYLYIQHLQENVSKTAQFQEGIALLTNAANKGNLKAASILGYQYWIPKDTSLKKDMNLAHFWLRKAAQQGNISAPWNLSHLYNEMKNRPISVEWCKQAAYQGYKPAHTALGHAYKIGTTLPKNDALGFYHCLVGQNAEDKGYVQSLLVVDHTPPQYASLRYESPQVTFEEHLTKIKTGKKLGDGEAPLAGLEFILKWNQDKIQEEEKAKYPSARITAIHKNVEAFAKDSLHLVADLEALNPAFFEISGWRFSQKVFADTLSQPDRPQIRITAARKVNLGEDASDASSLLHTFLGKLDERQNTVCQELRTLWAEAQKNQQEDDRELGRLRGRTGKDQECAELSAAVVKWGKHCTEIGEQMTAIETVGNLWKTLRASTAKNRDELFDEECAFKPKAQ